MRLCGLSCGFMLFHNHQDYSLFSLSMNCDCASSTDYGLTEASFSDVRDWDLFGAVLNFSAELDLSAMCPSTDTWTTDTSGGRSVFTFSDVPLECPTLGSDVFFHGQPHLAVSPVPSLLTHQPSYSPRSLQDSQTSQELSASPKKSAQTVPQGPRKGSRGPDFADSFVLFGERPTETPCTICKAKGCPPSGCDHLVPCSECRCYVVRQVLRCGDCCKELTGSYPSCGPTCEDRSGQAGKSLSTGDCPRCHSKLQREKCSATCFRRTTSAYTQARSKLNELCAVLVLRPEMCGNGIGSRPCAHYSQCPIHQTVRKGRSSRSRCTECKGDL